MLVSKRSFNKLNYLISKNPVISIFIKNYDKISSLKITLEKKNLNNNFFNILLLIFTFQRYGLLVKINNKHQKNFNNLLYFRIKNTYQVVSNFNRIFLINDKEFKLELAYNYIFKVIKKKNFFINFELIKKNKNNLNLNSYFFL